MKKQNRLLSLILSLFLLLFTLVNLSIRIIFQPPVQIADIRGIHADDVVGALVILPRNLLRVMRHERNVLLAQFIDCPIVRRIADLLTADSRRFDLPVTRNAFSLYQFLHDIFCHRTAAYIPMADKKYPHPNASCCFSPSYHTKPQSSRNFQTPVLPPFL